MTITREEIYTILKNQGHNSYIIAAMTESISTIANGFYKQGYELGRQHQRESDALIPRFSADAIAIRNNTGELK